jgi:hypothetical protein
MRILRTETPKKSVIRLAAIAGLQPSLRGIAGAAGLDKDTVSDAIAGRVTPKPRIVQRMATVLRVAPSVLDMLFARAREARRCP